MKKLRWLVAGMLLAATTINYLDRQALSIAGKSICDQYHFTETQFATIIGVFTLVYGIMQPLAGRLIDWLNTRRGFAISVIWWSLASMAHALGGGLVSFSVLRGLLAAGEAGNFPGAARAIAEWFPAKERASATGFFNCGAGLGAIIAPPLIGALILRWGWRSAFMATGILGFIWVWVWMIFYRSPEEHPRISKEELAEIRSGQEADSIEDNGPRHGAWLEVLSRRDFWALGLGRAFSDPAWIFYTMWLPKYLMKERGFTLADVAISAWVPFLAADIGSIFGGMLSSYFVKRGFEVTTARKIAMCLCAAMMPVALLVMGAPNAYVALAYFSIAAFGHQSWAASILTLPADLFPKRIVALASGLTATISMLGTLIFLRYVGWMLDHQGYGPVFTTVGFLHPIAAITVVWLLKSKRPTKPEEALVKTAR